MDWRDEGILLSSRRHGESAAIVEVFTAGHGRHAGIVRGGGGRRMAPILQPGGEVSVEWSARLEDHIGHFRIDPIRSRNAVIMADRAALAVLGSMTALISVALPERAGHPALYARSVNLLGRIGTGRGWPAQYALWELALLREIGFGLDLGQCAATGETADLIYVSPRTGRAVSRAGGAEWAARLLGLPPFVAAGIVDDAAPPPAEDLAAALALTGHFLETRLAPSLPRETLPQARGRAVDAMLRGPRQTATS